MTKRIFLIHGFCGSPTNHWYLWLKQELEQRGFKFHALEMPSPKQPKLSEWLSTLDKAVGTPDEETYFIGHSLGCITIVRYLEQLPENQEIGGCIFVAGFSGKITIPELQEFNENKVSIEKVKTHTTKFTTIFSTNDDVITLEDGKKFQELLNAKLIIEENKGHFCTRDGVTELHSVLEELIEMAQ